MSSYKCIDESVLPFEVRRIIEIEFPADF